MRNFDLIPILQRYHVPYTTERRYAKEGEVAVKCPFCRDDPSYHMTIRRDLSVWGCWRDSRHSGRRPHRLLQRLLGVSMVEVERILGPAFGRPLLDEFEARMRSLREPEVRTKEAVSSLRMPEELRQISYSPRFELALAFLRRRGFSDPLGVARFYKLHYATRGDWRKRVVLPVYDAKGRLVTWTGRAVMDHPLRYKTLSRKDGAICGTKDVVYLPPEWQEGGSALVVVEGPFDMLKLDWCGVKYGVRATCLFGTAYSEKQAAALAKLAVRFDRVYVMFDSGAEAHGMRFGRALATDFAGFLRLPTGVDDPGDLSEVQADQLLARLATPEASVV